MTARAAVRIPNFFGKMGKIAAGLSRHGAKKREAGTMKSK